MQQRDIFAIESTDANEDTAVKALSQPVELTEAQLLQVMGGLGPNGGWTTDSTTAGPNGGW
jgi:hypothetical protein